MIFILLKVQIELQKKFQTPKKRSKKKHEEEEKDICDILSQFF